jgi:hypothetical protein
VAAKDLTGMFFGELQVLTLDRVEAVFKDEKPIGTRRFWECMCSCGAKKIILGGSLTSGKTKTCGHGMLINKVLDLVGSKAGFLTYLKDVSYDKNHKRKILVRCHCGIEKEVFATDYIAGTIQSCGCYKKIRDAQPRIGKSPDLTGMKFGRLLVMGRDRHEGRTYYWRCLCDCGETTTVRTGNLKSGQTNSCGCIKKEQASQMGKIWKGVKRK